MHAVQATDFSVSHVAAAIPCQACVHLASQRWLADSCLRLATGLDHQQPAIAWKDLSDPLQMKDDVRKKPTSCLWWLLSDDLFSSRQGARPHSLSGERLDTRQVSVAGRSVMHVTYIVISQAMRSLERVLSMLAWSSSHHR